MAKKKPSKRTLKRRKEKKRLRELEVQKTAAPVKKAAAKPKATPKTPVKKVAKKAVKAVKKTVTRKAPTTRRTRATNAKGN